MSFNDYFKLGDIADFKNGINYRRSDKGEVIRIINVKELVSLNFVDDSINLPTIELQNSKYNNYLLQKNDIVIARSASPGEVILYKGTKPTIYSGFSIKINYDKSKIVPEFLFYYLQFYKNQVINVSNGTIFKNLNQKILGDINIPNVSINIQIEVANILSSLDDKIELNNKINRRLEELAQTIYKKWFVDFEFPDENGEPYKSSEGEMVDSELGMIPKGWNVRKMGDILATLQTGNRPPGGIKESERSGVPSIGAENVRGLGKYDYNKEKYIPEEYFNKLNRGKIQDKDILLYKDGAKLGRKTIVGNGFPHKKAAVNSHVFILRSNNYVTQEYLFFTLDQNQMTQNIINLNTSSAQPGINQKSLKSLKLITPTSSVLEKFTMIVRPILENIFQNCNQNRILEKTRQVLLPKLMNGEIKVPIEECKND